MTPMKAEQIEESNNEMVNHLLRLYPNADTKALLRFVQEHYKKEVLKKKTLIFSGGQANTRHYFVSRGLLRLYILDQNGREFNLLFAKEGQVLGDLATPKPTLYNLETVEDSVLYSIDNAQMVEMSKSILKTEAFESIDLMRRSYVFLQQRLVAILSKTAEDNYLDLRDNNPDLLQRLPQYHIASYLGVSAEFLSKIIARTSRR